MASKSVGQIVGIVVGAVAGFFIPGVGVMLGAAIGGALGSAIDPPKGPHIEGPRIDDLKVQTSTYGAIKPRAYGTVMLSGNVFWLEGDQLREVSTTEEQGGKGGGGSDVTKYSYYATFAVGLCKGPVSGIRRLWIGDDLVYSAVTQGDSGSTDQQVVENVISSGEVVNFTLFNGSDTQAPCARMQADKGVANVSGYPGEAWLLIEDLNLEKWSNTLVRAQVKAEVVIDGGQAITEVQAGTFPSQTESAGYGGFIWDLTRQIWSANIDNTGVTIISWLYRDPDGYSVGIEFERQEFSYSKQVVTREIDRYEMGGGAFNWFGVYVMCQSDEDMLITVQGSTGYPNDYTLGFHWRGMSEWASSAFAYVGFPVNGAFAIASRKRYFVAGTKIHEININGIVRSSPTVSVYWMGASENYLFALTTDFTGLSTTTVKKFSLVDLSLVATYSATTYGEGSLKVIDDDTFYTTGLSPSGNRLYKWVGGVVVYDELHGTSSSVWARTFNVLENTPEQLVYAENFVSFSGSPAPSIRMDVLSIDDTPAKLRDIITSECSLAGISSGSLDLLSLINNDVRGIKIATVSAVRSAFDPLRAAFPFDVFQAGYKIKFVSRGAASVATIAETDLGATADKTEDLLPVAREMSSQLPYSVSVTYLNSSREYDIDEQSAERLNSRSLNRRRVDLAIVLTPTEAAQIADVLLKNDWIGRTQLGPFYLPPTYLNLEPCDVVTISHSGAFYECRLTSIEYLPDGMLSCSAVSTAASVYTSSAVGEVSAVISQLVVPLAGLSEMILMDIPRISASQDLPGITGCMYGAALGWDGGSIFRSDDNGATYKVALSFSNKTPVFSVPVAIGSGRSDIVDSASIMEVSPEWDGAQLYSITELQMFSGMNLAAYGADGRWEIIGFKTVTDNSGTFTLKDLARGRFGTEFAMSLHGSNDQLVMLYSGFLGFAALENAAINALRLWRGVTKNKSIDSASDVSYTYNAVNLKCLSPVYLNGNRNPVSLDWSISWTRRSRQPVGPFSGIATPLGEASELYEVEVCNSDYSTVVRTIAGLSSPSATYSSANQVTDFGSNQTTLYLRIYQISATVGRGYPLQSEIYRAVSLDPYGAQVKLLMHMDDTGLTDVKGNTITLNAGAARSATQSMFGGYSAAFTGTGQYLSFPYSTNFAFSDQDFTIEMFVYKSANNANTSRLWNPSGDYYDGISISIDASGNLSCYCSTTGTNWALVSAPSIVAVPNGAWKHIVFQRRGGNLDCYFHGTRYAVSTSMGVQVLWSNSSYAHAIGGQSGTNRSLNGYIDEVRVTKGIARYSGDTITVPSAAFPNP